MSSVPSRGTSTLDWVASAAALLGGSVVIRRAVNTEFDVHDVLLEGLPSGTLWHLLERVIKLQPDEVLKGVGVSARTVRRLRKSLRASLSVEQSGRLWKFAALLARATEVFGDQATAEQWLVAPTFALGGRQPIDLLTTPVGERVIEQLLGRIEHGICV